MKHQAIRTVAMMLSVLLAATAAPVRAGNIHFGDVVQTIVDVQSGRSRVQLSLRAVSQSGKVPVASGTASALTAAQSGRQQTGAPADAQQPAGGTVQPTATTIETAPAQTGTSGQVQTVDLGDVTGTVCDCGEIPIPAVKSGLPLWPLLGGIPLICVTGICTGGGGKNPECVVNCGGGNTTVPEPATLLLFGSGLMALGAGVRRRRARRQEAVDNRPVAQV